MVGEAILVVISMPILFAGMINGSSLFKVIICTYLYKIIFAFTATLPATFVVIILKRKENIDIYDYDISFNPFALRDSGRSDSGIDNVLAIP